MEHLQYISEFIQYNDSYQYQGYTAEVLSASPDFFMEEYHRFIDNFFFTF